MLSLTAWTLTTLTAYGPLALVVIAYLGSLGIPFPITLVMVAAGAFSRAGLLDWRLALLACLLGAVLADQSEYMLGRLAQPWLKQRFGKNSAWQQAQNTLNRQGAWAILLTRFWLTPLAPAVNLLAGSRYPWGRFLLLDVFLGAALWRPGLSLCHTVGIGQPGSQCLQRSISGTVFPGVGRLFPDAAPDAPKNIKKG